MDDRSRLLETDLRFRQVGRKLNNALLERLPRDAVQVCGRRLSLVKKSILGL
jgi:hypothetical protein